jgi:hypothetical protein
MKKILKSLKTINLVLGFLSIVLFLFDAFVFIKLLPKMEAFEQLSRFEQPLLTLVGFGLLVLLLFYLLSSLQLIRFIKQIETIKLAQVIILIASVIALLIVFADVALLSDIDKQYRHGWDQPEWLLVYPLMAYQVLVTIILLVLNLSGKWDTSPKEPIARDINVFLIVQYVGVISSLLGLTLMSLGFFYSKSWNFTIHTLISGIIFLLPYGLALAYWVITKIREKDRQWFDEKQQRDLGKSALLTLIVVTLLMITLFLSNLKNLTGVISLNWFPFYLFGVLFVFSCGNLFYSSRG